MSAASFEAECAALQQYAQPELPVHADQVMAGYPGCVPSVAGQDRNNGVGLPAVDLETWTPLGSVVG